MNLFDLAYTFGAAALAPIWTRKTRGGWSERFGHTAALGPTDGRPRVLLHAVSVGEVNAIRGLVPMLRDAGVEVVVATTTDTGIARARELFAGGAGSEGNGMAGFAVARFPLDFSRSVARFLDAVRPDAVGLVELEVWPNFMSACERRGIPVGVINGRLSERSFRGYRRIRSIIGPSFRRLAWAAVQDEAYAGRFRAMGVAADKVRVCGSMKWDSVAIADDVPGSARLAAEMGIDRNRPLVVAGSTAEDEESLLHAACGPGVQLLCAPRKPEHFDEAARAMPGCVRRTERRGGAANAAREPSPASSLASSPASDRFLLDTIGELRAAYALADVVVVGRSFGTLYGSDPIEPAALGQATIIGPAYRDFESVVGALSAAGALRIVTREEVGAAIAELLGDPAARAAMARAGRACIHDHQGATARHAAMLVELAASRQRK